MDGCQQNVLPMIKNLVVYCDVGWGVKIVTPYKFQGCDTSMISTKTCLLYIPALSHYGCVQAFYQDCNSSVIVT